MADLSDLSMDVVLHRLVELAVATTGARYGALGVLGDDGSLDDFITVGVSAEERAAIGELPHGRGVLGLLIDHPVPVRIDDLGVHPTSVGFPPHHPPMRTFLGAPVMARGAVFGNLYLTEKQGGGPFTDEDERRLSVLAASAATTISNAHLHEETARRGRWVSGIRAVAAAILGDESPVETLRLVARQARELVDADVAAISVPAEEAGCMVVAAADGDTAGPLTGMRVPVEGSASGDVARRGVTSIFDDAMSSEETFHPMVAAGRMGPSVFVPLTARGQVIGTLVVARHPGRGRLTPDDAANLESFADQAALVLESGRAQQERRRLGLIEDRERIAKELHDGVIQSLFAVGMGLQGTAAMMTDARVADRLQEAIGEIDRAIGDLRNYIFGLRSHAHSGGRLLEALDRLAHDFERRTGVVTVADLEAAAEAVLDRHSDTIVQIVREAMSNVARHAGARTCRLSVRREGAAAVVVIDDDGHGFDTGLAHDGMGLSNLRARARAIGADLRVSSTPDEGTEVRLRVGGLSEAGGSALGTA